jgi:hypothetical protein
MAARGYTTATLVAHELAQTLSAPQLDQCADLIEAAEVEVDRETGRSWLDTSPVTGELHTVYGPVVYLSHRPVGTVSLVTIRPVSVGSLPQTLTAGSDYELIDATNGIILLAGYAYPRDVVINTEYTSREGFLLTVNYTHTLALDRAIEKITTELVAYWMRRRGVASVSGMTGDIKSFEVPDLLTVEYQAGAGSGLEVPPDLLRRLHAFTKVLIA